MEVRRSLKPKPDQVLKSKLTRTIVTSENTKMTYPVPQIFNVAIFGGKKFYSSGFALYKTNNYKAAIKSFKKGVNMIAHCRPANEKNKKVKEKLLKKLYIKLVICYSQVNKPFLACTYCNELNGLKCLWNHAKVLFHNAKALRMIGHYDEAKKKLKRAMKLNPGQVDMETEYQLLMTARNANKEAKQNDETVQQTVISDEFKSEVDNLVKKFKMNDEEDQLIIPSHFNSEEIAYFTEVCVKENLFFSKHNKSVFPDKEVSQIVEKQADVPMDVALQKKGNE